MKYDGTVFSIEIKSDVSNCHALRMMPDTMESDLKVGDWVICCIAVWSVQDLQLIPDIENGALQHPNISFGIRPFEDESELLTWCPIHGTAAASPIWIRLHDGVLVRQIRGVYDFEAAMAHVL